jgi:hypothetical protein
MDRFYSAPVKKQNVIKNIAPAMPQDKNAVNYVPAKVARIASKYQWTCKKWNAVWVSRIMIMSRCQDKWNLNPLLFHEL